MVETVHNAKLAENLNKAWEKVMTEKSNSQKLNVLVQINTSGEDGKAIRNIADVFTINRFFYGSQRKMEPSRRKQ